MRNGAYLAPALLFTLALALITSGCLQQCGKTTADFPLVVVNATADTLDIAVFSKKEEEPSVEFRLKPGESRQVVVKAIVRCNDLDRVSPITGPTDRVQATIIVTARNSQGQVAVREVRARNDEIERIEFRQSNFR